MLNFLNVEVVNCDYVFEKKNPFSEHSVWACANKQIISVYITVVYTDLFPNVFISPIEQKCCFKINYDRHCHTYVLYHETIPSVYACKYI